MQRPIYLGKSPEKRPRAPKPQPRPGQWLTRHQVTIFWALIMSIMLFSASGLILLAIIQVAGAITP